MKKIVLLLLFVIASAQVWACPACEKQQPKLLRGITHGTGPETGWDYIIIGITTAIVLITLFYSIKWLLRPAEQSASHIKRSILNAD